MGKRTLVFKRFTDSFKYLWKEAISDIIRDFHIYLMDHPDIEGIVERSIGGTDTILASIKEDGLVIYLKVDAYHAWNEVVYDPKDEKLNCYIFSCCYKSENILYNILSDESRTDIKIILDKYFYSIIELFNDGGINKLKHLYKYLDAPCFWNIRTATIISIHQKSLNYLYDIGGENPIGLYGDYIPRDVSYTVIITYFLNHKRKTSSIDKITIDSGGLTNFVLSAMEDDNSDKSGIQSR